MARTRLGWELDEMMWQRRIKSAADLARRLKAVGVDMTSVHLSRIIKERPQRLSIDLLEGLSTVLNCTMSDLMPVVGQATEEKPSEQTQPSIPAPTPAPERTPAPRVAPVEQPLPLEPARSATTPVQKPAGSLRVAWDGVKRPRAAFPKCESSDDKE